jgi:acyl carrier protein
MTTTPSSADGVKTTVRRYIDDNFIMGTSAKPLGDADSFLEHQVLDSTGFLELIAFLEERYGIRVADDEMLPENLDSLDAIEAYLARKGFVASLAER